MLAEHKIVHDDLIRAVTRATLQANASAADTIDILSALPLTVLRDAVAPLLSPQDLTHLASCSRYFQAALAPTLLLQSPRMPHPQSVAASPASGVRQINHETTLADIDQDFAASGLVLGRGTVMAWSAQHVAHPVARDTGEDAFSRPEFRSFPLKPCVALSLRSGMAIALPLAGAPYALRQELLSWPSPRLSPRSQWADPHADAMGRNLGIVPVGRRAASGSGWRVATEFGLRTYDVLGQDRLAPISWPFHAIGAVGDANRLWVLDDAHHVHTWRESAGTGLPDIAWKIPSARDKVPLWAAGAKGRLVVVYDGALTLATIDGVHAPLALPSHISEPTALTFTGHSYLGIGDAQGQVTLCHWPSGRFSPRFELGSFNGHRINRHDAVLAMVSDGPQRLYTMQKSGILRRLETPFAPVALLAPINNEAS